MAPITDGLLQPNVSRAIGAWSRVAHVRTWWGLVLNPVSSMKTIK